MLQLVDLYQISNQKIFCYKPMDIFYYLISVWQKSYKMLRTVDLLVEHMDTWYSSLQMSFILMRVFQSYHLKLCIFDELLPNSVPREVTSKVIILGTDDSIFDRWFQLSINDTSYYTRHRRSIYPIIATALLQIGSHLVWRSMNLLLVEDLLKPQNCKLSATEKLTQVLFIIFIFFVICPPIT